MISSVAVVMSDPPLTMALLASPPAAFSNIRYPLLVGFFIIRRHADLYTIQFDLVCTHLQVFEKNSKLFP